ncbi:hypothetical protein PR202_gb04501 [Eleusine coracana subsp. coracana]|uniref:DNA-(apurinic or apyrimidinic site) endonuclease n=1 Tax=Eleusine coracana subsp. coracana TaxID=191504 RepID=A0AAV5E3Z7_ELECO|nr:hypothetical protein PR202_gb04501 [Eleusine coracana subsp. coracana]
MPLLLRGASLLRLYQCSCGLPSANFSPRKLVLPRLNIMADQIRATYSRRAASKNREVKKDEQSVAEKEDASESELDIERFRSDPSQLQSMTVKELRDLTRRMGVSVKGNKKDLVSAIMDSLVDEENGKDGKSPTELVQSLEVPSKRKGGASIVVEENIESSEEKDVEVIKESLLDGYTSSFWTCSVSKLGYSGTAIISRVKPLSIKYGLGIPDHDTEGRVVTVEFDDFYLLTAYVPNSGDGLKRLTYRVTEWDPSLGNYMKELEKSKPVILTGDLNCAHQEIDIHDPAGNRRSAGFTNEERESFETNFLSKGFVDTFRKQHPNVVAYSYWGYRHNGRKTNKGWRLDYFLVSQSIVEKSWLAESWNQANLDIDNNDEHKTFSAQTVVQSGSSALELAHRENFDEGDVKHFKNLIEGYDNSYWSCSVSRLGYSGTAVISRKLEASKPVIVAGDLNCARQSMDIHNPPAKTQSAGFTVEERESFERNFHSKGLIDTFRKQHPNAVAYTFWGENQRITNKGWRLDYFLASESVADKVHDSYILPDVSFSDHSPIGLVLKL